jgi:hypothetical protein
MESYGGFERLRKLLKKPGSSDNRAFKKRVAKRRKKKGYK